MQVSYNWYNWGGAVTAERNVCLLQSFMQGKVQLHGIPNEMQPISHDLKSQ